MPDGAQIASALLAWLGRWLSRCRSVTCFHEPGRSGWVAVEMVRSDFHEPVWRTTS
jgi:hypothetical protein